MASSAVTQGPSAAPGRVAKVAGAQPLQVAARKARTERRLRRLLLAPVTRRLTAAAEPHLAHRAVRAEVGAALGVDNGDVAAGQWDAALHVAELVGKVVLGRLQHVRVMGGGRRSVNTSPKGTCAEGGKRCEHQPPRHCTLLRRGGGWRGTVNPTPQGFAKSSSVATCCHM
eukprot:356357-Chlamydomonas_euryale.AAC.8